MKRVIILLLFCSIDFSVSAQKLSIQKVEPPNWWTNISLDTLQLMVYGQDLKNATFSCSNKMISIVDIDNQSNEITFLDIIIDKSIQAQTIQIEVNNNEQTIQVPFRIEKNNKYSPKGFNESDLVYLIMPDRFSNGNTSNDNVNGMEKVNRQLPGARHGGDLKGITNNLDYIKKLGVTTLWLTPFEEMNDSNGSYHGYGASNFYGTDARYASGLKNDSLNNNEYKNFVNSCHQKKLKVIMDIVLNHIGNAHPWKTSSTRLKNWLHDSVINHFQMPSITDLYNTKKDVALMEKGWFVPSMPDLDQDNPRMCKYLTTVTLWWIQYASLDGIRLDTAPFSEKHFLTYWANTIKKVYPSIELVGEVWSNNNLPSTIKYWQGGNKNEDGYDSKIPVLMDIPFFEQAILGLKENNAQKIYNLLAMDYMYAMPNKRFIFMDNHDTERFFTAIEEDENKYKLGLLLIATTRGIPQLYYGSEFGVTGKKGLNDGYMRKDMPGGWPNELASAFTEKTNSSNKQLNNPTTLDVAFTNSELNRLKWNQQLWKFRTEQPVLHFGKLKHYAPINNIYAFSRYNDKEAILVFMNFSNDVKVFSIKDYAEITDGFSKIEKIDLSTTSFDNVKQIELNPHQFIILKCSK